MNRSHRWSLFARSTVPRVRGDEPPYVLAMEATDTCSPRARG